jgi:hypothetical protein
MKSPLRWPVSIPKFKLEISQIEACQQFDSNVGVERVLVNYRQDPKQYIDMHEFLVVTNNTHMYS